MRKFAQIIVSLIAMLAIIYAAAQNDTAWLIVNSVCLAIVASILIVKFNVWIFSEPAPKREREPKHKRERKRFSLHDWLHEYDDDGLEYEDEDDYCDHERRVFDWAEDPDLAVKVNADDVPTPEVWDAFTLTDNE